jgi:hypothetical protein
MSYSRWSNSSWYSFYNVNGKLSLWYDMDHCIDLEYEDALEITAEEIVAVYGCSPAEAAEALQYVAYFIDDYDPEVGKEHKKEVAKLLDKWKELGEKDES